MAELELRRAAPIPPRGEDAAGGSRSSGPLPGRRARIRYWSLLTALATLAVVLGLAHLAWDNPMPFGTDGFWLIAEMRSTALVVIAVVAFCQALATVSFQSVTNNRILTPSVMGFESLYIAVQTAAVYFFGVAGLAGLRGPTQFALQIMLMVLLSLVLYGWLLSGRYGDLHVMLLVGIVLGGGLGAVSTFLQRMLTPSEFDLLAARMFGSVATAETAHLPIALPLCLGAGALLWWRARRLDVLALGAETSTRLGLHHRREMIAILVLVSVLMAVSTALIGPMTFFGFLVATLTYQFADTYSHRHLFPIAALLGFVVLCGAYVVMKNVFYAQGAVSIIIELVGGSVFLFVVLRKGRL